MLPWQPSPYSHCSVLRRRGRRVNYEIGLWPLTLLLFNHIVYTSMAVVKCPLLVDYDGRRLPVSVCVCEDEVWCDVWRKHCIQKPGV